ncbi:MAG: hypothetical protein KatS3mg104_3057 [Phycisphaerae bacterium]|nr:MAG: hypothetical protein KatS3mg104_3057 [Phycisphaerae bacterium]
MEDLEKSVTKIAESIEALDKKFADKSSVDELSRKVKELKADIQVIKDNRLDDPKFGFKSVGEYAIAVMKASDPSCSFENWDERLKILTKGPGTPTGVSQGYDPSVGFLFPPGFSPGLSEVQPAPDNLISLTRQIPIDPSQESITLNYVDDLDRSTGAIRGGVKAYWKSEAEQMVGTRPKLRQITLRPNELYSMAYATDKSLRNAPIALGAFLTQSLQQAVNFTIGDAIVNGDGVGKPIGIKNHSAKITVNKETGQAAGTLNEANLVKMWARIPAAFRGTAVWLANQDIESALYRMSRNVIKLDGTSLESADTPPVYNPETNTIFGRPVIFVEYAESLGTEGDIILWDPQHYLVATKTGQGPEMSIHFKFDVAESAFRFIFEIDGKPDHDQVIKPYKGNVTRSSIVTLQTR